MTKISVTYFVNVIDEGYDEECGWMASEDGRFVISGLPLEHVPVFLEKVAEIRGCSQRPASKACQDGRLRVDWNEFCDYEEFCQAKEKILKVIKNLVPDAKVRYRRLGSGILSETGDYDDDDDLLTLEGAFTDEERECLSLDERADMLGMRAKC